MLCVKEYSLNIWEVDKLFLFIGFVIPGFISIKLFELLFPGQIKESSKQLVDAVAYSCINYALLLYPIYCVESSDLFNNHTNLYVIFYVFVLFVAPIIWTYIWKKLRETNAFQKNAPHPIQKPWDYVFSQRKSFWVIVTLKDQTQIAGLFSGNSFASSAPSPEQIYLERSWKLNGDGGFEREHNQTDGVIIISSEISHVELFKVT